MPSGVDLHIHTTASDGRFRPEEIVSRAAGLGLSTIAITDHDTVGGVPGALQAANLHPGLRVIPGVELSTDFARAEVHILGYFIDTEHGEFIAGLKRMRHSRDERARAMIEKLKELGVHIEWTRVKEMAAGGSVGRPHLARAMLEKGYIDSFTDAFNGYIERGGPAYAEREKVTPAEAVGLIRSAGGLAVLAHPLFIDDWQQVVVELRGAGLAGIEVYYDGYTAPERERLRIVAEKYGLVATGGSDFHGIDPATETGLGSAGVPPEVVDRLVALAKPRALPGTIEKRRKLEIRGMLKDE